MPCRLFGRIKKGEENDVIILSLVRNNSRKSVGFLSIANRVCVALSRARNGLYMLGNIDLLAKCSPLWSQIQKTLTENGEIGEEIPLRCDRHHHIALKVLHKSNVRSSLISNASKFP